METLCQGLQHFDSIQDSHAFVPHAERATSVLTALSLSLCEFLGYGGFSLIAPRASKAFDTLTNSSGLNAHHFLPAWAGLNLQEDSALLSRFPRALETRGDTT